MNNEPTQPRYDTNADPISAGTKVGIGAALVLAAAIVALLIIGARAPKSPVASAVTTQTTAPSASAAKSGAVTVNVRAGEYFFKSDMTTFKVGVPYHFIVHNVGAIPHEFMIVQPIMAGMMSMDAMDAMAVGHIEAADLQTGQTSIADVTFTKPYPSGTLEMACHVGQHYEKGMHIPIIVTP
jgi:uncharacterized cupredoxin-like copper-binding protein